MTARCSGCAGPLPPGRADRRFCSPACRQRAYRGRRQATPLSAPASRVPRADTVYECPTCQARLLGEQRCPECNVFCRRLGPGGPCPHCDEPVALSDLVRERAMSATRPVEMPGPSGPWTALRADHIPTGSTTTFFIEGESPTT